MLQPRRPTSLKIQLLLSLGALAFLAMLGFIFYFMPPKPTAHLDVTVFSQPRPLQAFELNHATEKNRRAVFSQADLARHWTFLFFGFTHCSDVCPATLTELNEAYQALQILHPELQIVFVSIDPEHETAADLARYATSFNEHFIGLSGSEEQVKKLRQQFGVLAERDDAPGSSAINHTSSIFLINPQGEWLAVFPYGLRAKQIQTNFQTVIETITHV